MHPNPIFRSASEDRNVAFARARGFGALCVNGGAGPLLAHVPFVLSDDGREVELHLVRSNPVARATGSAVLAVTGPDGYISPDWYGIEQQVPTWNYVAVHLRGRLEPMPQEALRGVLDRISAEFERRLAPKPEWLTDKVDADGLARMMRMIQPFRLIVDSIDGTWKLGQNKTADARAGAADGLQSARVGQHTDQLADLMRGVDSAATPT